MPIIAPIPRAERRLMQKAIHKTCDKNHARRLTAMLMLHRGDSVSNVVRTLCCARSSVGRWSTELLAIKFNKITGCQLHAGTVRRWLPSAGVGLRRAAPTLRISDPHKDEKMAAIHKALKECNPEHPVFYEDEVDIHLNTKIGADWQLHGQQKRVITPGQNEKYYLAGALHSGTGKVKFSVIYQPVYSPWVNHVERLWQALHDTITRNHHCRTMWQLLSKVHHFMETVSPFPGAKHG